MANKFKKSLAILQHEFQLQVYTVGTVIIFFILAFAMTKSMNSAENELPKMFIIFYTMIIGLVLPWQMNTKGHISPGYCRYHLSLPVATWQLYLLPLACRLLLLFVFIGIELLLYNILYGGAHHHYLNAGEMWQFSKISLLIYLTLQAYGWSKDSFKNLYFYLGIAFAVYAFVKPAMIPNIITDRYFSITVLFLVALAIVGVRNLRFGTIFVLPSIQNIFNLMRKKRQGKEKNFKSAVSAQFHYEWQRTWFYMPVGILLAIFLRFLFHVKYGQDLYTIHDLLGLAFFYAVVILLVSVIGIVFIDNKGFKSSYINHLPIATKYLAEIRLKCFSLSFAISLAMLFLSGIILYSYNNKISEIITATNFEFMNSPTLLIWFVASLFIWSFAVAFFIASTYFNNRIISIALPVLVLFYYISGKFVFGFYSGNDYELWIMPKYMPLATMIFAMVTIKLGLLYLNKRNVLIKAAYIVTAAVASFAWVLLSNQLLVFIIAPVVLICCFPLMAYKHKMLQQRHENSNTKIKLPWKLVNIVSLILVAFASYTYIVNQQQERKLKRIIQACETINTIPTANSKKINVGLFIDKNMPYKAENIKPLKQYFSLRQTPWVKISSIKTDSKACYAIVSFFDRLIYTSIRDKKYARAFKYYLFSNELALTNHIDYTDRYYYYRLVNPSTLYMTLQYYNPTDKELTELDNMLKQIFTLYIISIKKELNKAVSSWENGNAMELSKYGINSKNYRFIWLNVHNISNLTLSPIITGKKIDHSASTLSLIKSLNFMLGEKKYDRLSFKMGAGYPIHGTYPMRAIQKARVYIAMLRYRHKYGKFPNELKQLAPEFINSYELYLINDSTDYYYNRNRVHKKSYLILLANSIKAINKDMECSNQYAKHNIRRMQSKAKKTLL